MISGCEHMQDETKECFIRKSHKRRLKTAGLSFMNLCEELRRALAEEICSQPKKRQCVQTISSHSWIVCLFMSAICGLVVQQYLHGGGHL